MGLIGMSNGMLDAGAFSAMADLIQKKFPSNCYGRGYALLEAAYCLSAVLGELHYIPSKVLSWFYVLPTLLLL